MAAKRISQSSVNWASLAERVPPTQKDKFLAFKTRSDKYLRALLANPEQSPKIDWSLYKNKIPNAALVESFQKQYEALKVPYPADNLSADVDKLRSQVTSEIAAFKTESAERIAKHKADIERIQGLLAYNQMTLEDFRDAHPDLALDPIKRPTFWPHEAEIQPGYVDPSGEKEEEHH